MPFLEVFDFKASLDQRRRATTEMTNALCQSYGILPDIVSTYFFDIAANDYAHAGVFPAKEADRRVFIKLHAFPRPIEMRRAVADSLTQAAVSAYGANPQSIVIYFLERQPSEAAHGGKIAD